MATAWNLPVAFYFQVKIGKTYIAFKEVSGLGVEMVLETIPEGGVNDYEHKVPKQLKHENLVLKRALLDKNNEIIVWIRKILEGDLSQPIEVKNILINLMSSEHTPLYSWTCERVYPVKWNIDNLDSEKNSVLIESLEFAYTTLKRS